MPRASDGTVTLPSGNPVVAGKAALASVENATMADIASMLEDSLSRSGKGGMASPMLFADGTSAAPGVAFTNEPTSGLFRQAGSKLAMSVASVIRQTWDSALSILTAFGDFRISVDSGGVNGGNLTVDKNVAVGGGLGVVGNLGVNGTAAVDGTSTFTGRMTLGAGVAGILITDLPLPATTSTLSNVLSATPTVVAGDVAWHDVIGATSAFATTVTSTVLLTVGPGAFAPSTPIPASADPGTGYFVDIDSAGATGPAFLRLVRAPTPFTVWSEVATTNIIYFQGGGTTWTTGAGFAVLDQPGVGAFQYKVQGRVSHVQLTMTVYCARLQGVQIG